MYGIGNRCDHRKYSKLLFEMLYPSHVDKLVSHVT